MVMFGLHRFRNVTGAFLALEGCYGEAFEGSEEMCILQDYEFQRIVFGRFCRMFMLQKLGETTIDGRPLEDTIKYAVPTNENGGKVTDYFTDFNYFLLSRRNSCFYTSYMTFKDDGATEFDEQQWDIAFELIDSFEIQFIYEQAKRITSNEDIKDFDDINNYMAENHLQPLSYSEYDDLALQLTDILNKEINEQLQ